MTNNESCATCKFFGKGESTLAKAMVMTAGTNYWPSSTDIMAMSEIDKDGDCTFFPQRVAKRKTDYCGQWKAKQ